MDKSFLSRLSSEALAMESDLNLFNLLETTYCLLKAYTIWLYIRLLRVTKLDRLVSLVRLFVCNLKAKINNNYSQRKNLLQWIRTKLKPPVRVNNFREDWRNGVALCALIEALVPGSCPRYDLLNPEQAIDNLNLGLSLVKKHLNFDSPIESREIWNCSEEAKLVYLLSRIKMESMKSLVKSLLRRPIIQVTDSSGNTQKVFESLFGEDMACFAKGMGLILGVRTRRARFNIFCKPSPKLNLIIEISGPNNTMCSEKITVHNPKKRVSAEVVTHSLIADYLNRKKTTEDIMKIPFFYEVMANKIVVTYIPLMVGVHKLSIIWQGQHILDSPYTVKVEECTGHHMTDHNRLSSISSPSKFVPGFMWPVPAIDKQRTLSLDECATVVSRKVLKQTVIVNGRQTVINDFTSDLSKNKLETGNCAKGQFAGVSGGESHKKGSDSDKRNNTSHSILHRRKLEKLVINSYESSSLADIKENDSITCDRLDINDTNQMFVEEIQHSNNLVNNNLMANNCDNYEQNIGSVGEQRVDTSEALVKYQAVNVDNTSKMSSFNNANNRPFIPTFPVKNMIHNWETKLAKNVNEMKDKDKTVNKHLIGPSVPVKDRLEIFENNNCSISETNWNNSVSQKSVSQTIREEMSEEIVSDITPALIEEETRDDLSSDEPDVKSPESHPDSGISSHDYIVTKNNRNLLYHKSLSFPNLRDADIPLKPFIADDITNNEPICETQASTYSGQYIDDEIPDYSNLFLGRYVSYTGLLNNDIDHTYDDFDFNKILDIENDLTSAHDLNSSMAQDLGIYPEKCEVIGAGAYYGQVGIKNSFLVCTKDGGRSYLAVGVQSGESDDVIEVSFTSISQHRYEVHYQVARPGYYVIFVKWGDYNVADSPFICKVTY